MCLHLIWLEAHRRGIPAYSNKIFNSERRDKPDKRNKRLNLGKNKIKNKCALKCIHIRFMLYVQ